MAPHAHAQRGAFRLGRMVGGAWRGYVRRERRFAQWLVADWGMPMAGAKALLWAVKLSVLAALLYVAFWLAFGLALVLACAWMAAHADLEPEDPKPEWRDGHSGFGLYDKNEWRYDPGGPDDQ